LTPESESRKVCPKPQTMLRKTVCRSSCRVTSFLPEFFTHLYRSFRKILMPLVYCTGPEFAGVMFVVARGSVCESALWHRSHSSQHCLSREHHTATADAPAVAGGRYHNASRFAEERNLCLRIPLLDKAFHLGATLPVDRSTQESAMPVFEKSHRSDAWRAMF